MSTALRGAPLRVEARAPKGKGKGKKGKAAPQRSGGGSKLQQTDLSNWYGPGRKLYLPSGLIGEVPEYLNGELPGDYGYDPLRLGEDPEKLQKYQENELIHARWAMLGAVGCLVPEGLARAGADIKGSVWWQTAGVMLKGEKLNWFAVPFKNFEIPFNLPVVVVINAALIGAAETFRKNGTAPGGFALTGKFEASEFDNYDKLHPGGIFDPLNFTEDPQTFEELKVKEIKNGRLAMFAMLGFFVQAAVTKEGPYANFVKHLRDPFGYNLVTILQGVGREPTL